MSAKKEIKTAFANAVDEVRSGKVVRIKPFCALRSALVYVYEARKDLAADDINVILEHEDDQIALVLRDDLLEVSAGSQPVHKKQKPSINQQVVGSSLQRPVFNQLFTTAVPTLEILNAIQTLLDAKVIETVEFIGTSEAKFLTIAGDRFIGKPSKNGYVIV